MLGGLMLVFLVWALWSSWDSPPRAFTTAEPVDAGGRSEEPEGAVAAAKLGIPALAEALDASLLTVPAVDTNRSMIHG